MASVNWDYKVTERGRGRTFENNPLHLSREAVSSWVLPEAGFDCRCLVWRVIREAPPVSSPDSSSGKEPTCQCRRHKSWVRSLGLDDPLEKGMATPSSILAWRIPSTEEPGGLQSIGLQRVGHDWCDLARREAPAGGQYRVWMSKLWVWRHSPKGPLGDLESCHLKVWCQSVDPPHLLAGMHHRCHSSLQTAAQKCRWRPALRRWLLLPSSFWWVRKLRLKAVKGLSD